MLRRLALLALVVVAGCRGPQPRPEPEEAVLARLPEGYSTPAVSGDCRHLAYFEKWVLPPAPGSKVHDYKWRAVVDGKPGPTYDGIPQQGWLGDLPCDLPPHLSPTGGHCAYWVHRDKRSFVVRDGMPGKAYDAIYDVCFSPDGKHLGYIGGLGKEQVAVLDGKELTRGIKVAISRSCTRAATVVPVAGGVAVRLNGSTAKAYDKVPELDFSPDGTRFAYIALAGQRRYVVLDGVEYGPYRNPPDYDRPRSLRPDEPSPDILFSPNGSLCVWLEETAGKWSLWLNGKATWTSRPSPGEEHDWGLIGVAFSADGKHFALASRQAGKWVIVRDGREEALPKGMDWPGSVCLSADGHSLAYICGERANDYAEHIVRDAHPGPVLTSVMDLAMSPDGKHVTYTVRLKDGRDVAAVDGWRSRPNRIWDTTGAPVFGPDGKHWAVAVPRGKKRDLVVDGKVVRTYDDIIERRIAFDGASTVRLIAARNGKAIRIAFRIR